VLKYLTANSLILSDSQYCHILGHLLQRFFRAQEGSGSPLAESGNTEQGKCQLMNEYPFFLFLNGRWYYEKNILYL